MEQHLPVKGELQALPSSCKQLPPETQQKLGELALRGRLTSWSCNDQGFLVWDPYPRRKRSTAIVSSRLGRNLFQKDEFFRVLRIACSQLDPAQQGLLSATGTATHPYVERAAQLFGLTLCTLDVANARQQLDTWAERLLAKNEWEAEATVYLSPPLRTGHERLLTSKQRPASRDAWLIENADQLLAIHLRQRGSIEALLRRRLENCAADNSHVFIALGPSDLVPPAVAAPLMDLGAVGWHLVSTSENEESNSVPALGTSAASISSVTDCLELESYLSHCTRSVSGPWPDQTEQDHLDELILGNHDGERSAFSALCRILMQQRLLATDAAIREGISVVSFTAVPLSDLHQLRCFRAHRGRWDFEPYGIAVRKIYLQRLGARQVIYGDESTWSSLDDTDRGFFQKVGTGEKSVDWRVEREWRLIGDLPLSEIPENQAMVFVKTPAEARQIAYLSDWPIVVMQPQ